MGKWVLKCTRQVYVIFIHLERCLHSSQQISAMILDSPKMCFFQYLVIMDVQLAISCWTFMSPGPFMRLLFRIAVEGAVASWLVRSSPDWVVRVRALAGDIVLCSWARHFTLTVALSTQVYKWVPANLMLGVTLRWTRIPSRGVEILLVASCYRNRDKLQPDGPLGSHADFTSLGSQLDSVV